MYILTFDVEEWFHLLDHEETRSEARWTRYESRIERNLERIFRILSECDARATFFCLGWIAEKYPKLVLKIAEAGYEVACHSSAHQLAFKQTPRQFQLDLSKAKDQISTACGVEVKTYRIPGFSLTSESLWALEILAREGFEVDCSIFPAVRGHGGLPGFSHNGPCTLNMPSGSLKELPLNTASVLGRPMVFSGGGYFRILPYRVLRRLFNSSNYVMTYFHPRDFDAEQPVVPNLSLKRRFKSYVGLKNAEVKLRALLRDFYFMDVADAVSKIDWDHAPKIDVSVVP